MSKSRLAEWLAHRERLLSIPSHDALAEAAGVRAEAVARAAGRGTLAGVGRGTRALLARALKVSLRDLEGLASGRRDWIDDDRLVELDRLAPGYVRPRRRGGAANRAAAEARPCAAGGPSS